MAVDVYKRQVFCCDADALVPGCTDDSSDRADSPALQEEIQLPPRKESSLPHNPDIRLRGLKNNLPTGFYKCKRRGKLFHASCHRPLHRNNHPGSGSGRSFPKMIERTNSWELRIPVSYTHLDVYKRPILFHTFASHIYPKLPGSWDTFLLTFS